MTESESTEKESQPTTSENKPLEDRPITEVGGRLGLEPTRYGDWEKNGRCVDF